MVLPLALPAIIGGASMAAGALGSLTGRKKAKTIDVNPFLDAINRSKQKQTDISTGLKTNLQPLGTQYQEGVGSAVDTAEEARRASSQKFLEETGKATDLQGKQLSDILRQRVLEGLPGLQAQTREGLAATGGLQRGSANQAMTDIGTSAAQQIGQGEQELVTQTLAAKNQALQQVYQLDDNFIQTRLGIDKDTLLQLYQSGREDLINEANQLLGIEQNAQAQEQDIRGFAAGQEVAADTARLQRQQDLYNALIQGGGSMLGSSLSRGAAPAASSYGRVGKPTVFSGGY